MSSVYDLQSMEAVSRPLNQGILHLCNICECLNNVYVNPTTGLSSNFNQMRKNIEDAAMCLSIADRKIQDKLRYLDENMERLFANKQNLEQQKQENSKTLDRLHTEKKSAEEMLRYSREALSQAEKNLETAYYALKSAHDRRKQAEDLTIAGGVLIGIPILGWIAGSVMLSQGVPELDRASDDIRAAEREQQKFHSQMKEKTQKIYEYDSQIYGKQDEINYTIAALSRIEGDIKRVQKTLEITAYIQEKVRSTVNLVSVLSGRVGVLEKQTRRFANWRAVVNIMEDVTKAVIDVAENRLLNGDRNSALISALRKNVEGLVAICNSPSNSEYDDYS